ncbi:MAG: hypothetical protein N2749_06240 [Clostridia bacterium]|nr:hypothetical protein [Clostridia bacterium]
MIENNMNVSQNMEKREVNENEELNRKIEELQEELKNLPVTKTINDIKTIEKFISDIKSIFDEDTMINFIEIDISNHFKLKANQVKKLIKNFQTTNKNKQNQNNNSSLTSKIKTAIETLNESEESNNFSVGQDYINNMLIYGVNYADISYIITSNHDFELLENVGNKLGLKANSEKVETSKISKNCINDFINNKNKENHIVELYNMIKNYYKTFMYFDDGRTYDVLSIWTMNTYIYKTFQTCPYLWLNADKGSGKTLLLELLQNLCFNAQISANSSSSSIFRYVEFANPTLLIDEFENIMNDKNGELLTLLNSGYKSESKVRRTVSENNDFTTKSFSGYCPKAFAGINDIGNVLRDRCIVIRLLKAPKGTNISQYRKNKKVIDLTQIIIHNLYLFGLSYCKEINELYSSESIECPDELSFRDRELWEPLLCISKIIDNNREDIDTYRVEEVLRSYAIDKALERSVADTEDNISYKLIKDLLEIVREDKINPIIISNKTYYNNDDLYDYLVKTCEYFFRDKKSLTKILKDRLNITNERYTLSGIKYRGYIFDKTVIEDLAVRYNIL